MRAAAEEGYTTATALADALVRRWMRVDATSGANGLGLAARSDDDGLAPTVLVVDDSIVVLENIYRRIEQGEAPLLAAYRGAREVGFAVVATTLVLISVFVPLVFMQGQLGKLFTEFALAVAAAVAFSSVVALTLSPMLCSKLLTHRKRESKLGTWLHQAFAKVFFFFHQRSHQLHTFLFQQFEME